MSKKIKWCAIQPLTGGMYLGTEEAIGHKAEFILSYPGLGDVSKTDEQGNVISAGNEYSLMKYLEKKNDLPDYRVFNRKMFQNDNDMNPEILTSQWSKSDTPLDYSDMDLCIAVPVCAGLSQATIASGDTKDARNCNMIWITKYALNSIKPKVYIFENAPTLMGHVGNSVRKNLEDIAQSAGYSVVYYKTDTKWHHNCQKRPRTFILFFKQDDMNNIQNPELGFEHETLTIDKYFDMIPEDATQQVSFEIGHFNKALVSYYKDTFGDNYLEKVTHMSDYMVNNKLYNDIIEHTNKSDKFTDKQKESVTKALNHIKEKMETTGRYYSAIMFRPKDLMAHAVMFRMMQCEMHYKYERLYTVRECLHLMGHPHDFELQGDVHKEYPKIGQNVPVKTAKWIVSQAIKNIDKKQNPTNSFVRFFNNNSMKEEKYKEAV